MAAGVRRPVALVILDGWGVNESAENNAVRLAVTPRLDALFRNYPSCRIGASGMNVGLPEGQMGNSEVGHLNLGAGRVVYQDLTRITKSIDDGDFFTNPVLADALAGAKRGGGKLHLMGLLSDGGVHSHNTHLYALVEMAARCGLTEVCIHPFLDGRDTPPKSAARYLAALEAKLADIGVGRVATVIGRYYAMDRDSRWERVERAFRALTQGEEKVFSSSAEAIENAYIEGQTDEFVEPRVIRCAQDRPCTVDDGDVVVFFNFRSDRAREITRVFTDPDFQGFPRAKSPVLGAFVCMTEYDETFGLPVAFAPETHANLLGEVLSGVGMRQLRIAETEKYAHVTFFFNGGREAPFPGEDRVLIPSPKDVATYDLKPAMSASALTEEVVERVRNGAYDFVVLNFANPDMVGHTGVAPAAVTAMETVDSCVGRVVDAVLETGGSLLVTADHGNCEQMTDASGQPHTAHTANPVPLILVDPDHRGDHLRSGILADIAPTVLQLMALPKPSEMTGRSLLDD